MPCEKLPENCRACTCSYPGCPRKGKCCECVAYHRRNNEIPGCFFPKKEEATYDRSYEYFATLHSERD
jgi:hypothetical protein